MPSHVPTENDPRTHIIDCNILNNKHITFIQQHRVSINPRIPTLQALFNSPSYLRYTRLLPTPPTPIPTIRLPREYMNPSFNQPSHVLVIGRLVERTAGTARDGERRRLGQATGARRRGWREEVNVEGLALLKLHTRACVSEHVCEGALRSATEHVRECGSLGAWHTGMHITVRVTRVRDGACAGVCTGLGMAWHTRMHTTTCVLLKASGTTPHAACL